MRRVAPYLEALPFRPSEVDSCLGRLRALGGLSERADVVRGVLDGHTAHLCTVVSRARTVTWTVSRRPDGGFGPDDDADSPENYRARALAAFQTHESCDKATPAFLSLAELGGGGPLF